MADPYQILGVSKSATADELKSAYRKLAKKLHPDVNPGRKDIEQKFKEVTAAYDLLSDADKRAKFDRGEIDAMGNDRGFAGAGGGGQWRNYSSRAGAGGGACWRRSVLPIRRYRHGRYLRRIHGRQHSVANAADAGATARGADVTYSLSIPFTEAALGGKRRVTLSSGKTIDVTIPPGTHEGSKLRLRGQGEEGPSGNGDAIIEIHVEPHPYFTRKDNDITLEAPVSLPEAVLGASIKVPTLDGHVTVKVPKGANTGTTLRLKGKGIPDGKSSAGDMFVKLKIMLPDEPSDDLATAVEKWAKKHDYDPRKKLGW